MRYKSLGKTNVELSCFGLGGHEFLPDGRSRGFNEDFKRAVTPGELFEGFGGERRRAVMAAAHEAGINFFDATIDSEKEALGRNFKALPPPREVYVQTRPEGMVYTNNPEDKHNWRMAEYKLLQPEVRRILDLLGRRRIDFLNFGFLASALDHDPHYLTKIAHNIKSLKDEGLIRFACADNFSGEATYLRQIETGCFDAIFINFNFADDGGERRVLPVAAERGLGVFCREAFMKGALFTMGGEAGFTDRKQLAQISLKWILAHQEVTTIVVGIDHPQQLADNLEALEQPTLTDDDRKVLDALKATRSYREYHDGRLKNISR